LKLTVRTLALAAAFATGSAFAAGAAHPAAAASGAMAPASPAKRALIRALIQLQQPAIEGMAAQMVQQPAMTLMRQAEPAVQAMPADKRAAAVKAVQADVKRYADETVPLVRDKAVKLAPSVLGPILEQNLSEDELRTVIAWLQSPASKKFSEISGHLQEALADKLVAETQGTVAPKVDALRTAMAKDLGLPAPAAAASAPAAPAPQK
jgi:hypothetical protein